MSQLSGDTRGARYPPSIWLFEKLEIMPEVIGLLDRMQAEWVETPVVPGWEYGSPQKDYSARNNEESDMGELFEDPAKDVFLNEVQLPEDIPGGDRPSPN